MCRSTGFVAATEKPTGITVSCTETPASPRPRFMQSTEDTVWVSTHYSEPVAHTCRLWKMNTRGVTVVSGFLFAEKATKTDVSPSKLQTQTSASHVVLSFADSCCCVCLCL